MVFIFEIVFIFESFSLCFEVIGRSTCNATNLFS